MDRAHRAMEAWIVTVIAVLAAVGSSAMTPGAPPRSRLLKVPKVYNALITSDIPLLPSRAETAATAAVGPVLLYSTHLPVILQPQAQGTTPQHHLDRLSQLQNQLQREEIDQQQLQLQAFEQPLTERQPVQQQLYPEPQLPIQQSYPVKQLPVQQQYFPGPPQHPGRQLAVPQHYLPERLPGPQQHPVRQLSVQQQIFPESLHVPPQQPVKQPVQQQLFPESLPVPPQQPVRQPVQQQLFPESLPVPPQQPVRQPVQQQLFPERLPVPQQLPARQLPIQQQLFPEPQLPVQQQLFPERQQLAGSHHHPSQVQQIPVQHLSTEQLPPQQFDISYQQKSAHPTLQQQYPQIDAQLQHKRLQLQHQKQLQLQVQQQKQLQLNQFVDLPKVDQNTSYLPMPETNSYQPPPSVHIDEIKNNKPSNTAIPDVPPPPLPVGKRLQTYSYNSPDLSPPPPTNHHVPFG